jgi:signal transduction histidine kinase
MREDGSPFPDEMHPAAITLATGQPQSQVVMGMRRGDGALQWLSLNTEPLKHAGDEAPYGVVITLSDITESKLAERALREYASSVQQLSRRLVEIEEAERRSLNRELHDRIGQDLAAIKLNIELIRAMLAGDARHAVAARLDDARNLVQATIDNTRNIMAGLRPPGLDDYGLAVALKIHAHAVEQRLGIPVRVTGEDPKPRLTPAAEAALFRIAQEALNNTTKHAHARNVEIALILQGSIVALNVTDDGTGFDATGKAPAASYGLRTMRERAEAIGARLAIESMRGRGTRIVVTLERAA